MLISSTQDLQREKVKLFIQEQSELWLIVKLNYEKKEEFPFLPLE